MRRTMVILAAIAAPLLATAPDAHPAGTRTFNVAEPLHTARAANINCGSPIVGYGPWLGPRGGRLDRQMFARFRMWQQNQTCKIFAEAVVNCPPADPNGPAAITGTGRKRLRRHARRFPIKHSEHYRSRGARLHGYVHRRHRPLRREGIRPRQVRWPPGAEDHVEGRPVRGERALSVHRAAPTRVIAHSARSGFRTRRTFRT
jgi:hypothetical protein